MNKVNYLIKFVSITFLFFINTNLSNADSYPPDFSDLASRLSPSVVSISITMSKEPPPQGLPQFPPGSPFEDFFNEFFDLNQCFILLKALTWFKLRKKHLLLIELAL